MTKIAHRCVADPLGPASNERRRWLGAGASFAGAAAAGAWASGAWRATRAQTAGTYPGKPVRVLVPYAPGGSADNAARIVSEKVAAQIGQPFVIDNRPGASGTIAAAALAQAPGDGYTLMVAPTAVAAITPLTRKTPYDPLKDFTAVAKLTGTLSMLSISPATGAKTLPELIKMARENPGQYAFGSSGIGTITHLTGEVLQQSTGVKLLHVPYKSIVEGMGDFQSGRIAMVFDPFILPQVRAGRAIAAAALATRRHPEFPEVPTVEELGIDMRGFFNRSWFGLFGPKDMPREVLERLNAEVEKALRDPEVGRKLVSLGLVPEFVPSSRFGPQLADDIGFFGDLIRKLDLKLEN